MFLNCIRDGWKKEYDARPNIHIVNDLLSNFYAAQPDDDKKQEEEQIDTKESETQCHVRGLEEYEPVLDNETHV